MRVALALLGFALIYAGAFFGWIGLSGAGCEWGNAQGLVAGVPALLSYTAGTVGLLVARPRRLTYLALLPVAPFLAQQAIFANRLAIGMLGEGASACGALLAAPMGPSGEEGFFLLLWLALVLVPVVGVTLAYRRARV